MCPHAHRNFERLNQIPDHKIMQTSNFDSKIWLKRNNYIFYIKKGVFLNIDILNITAAIQTGARAHIKQDIINVAKRGCLKQDRNSPSKTML